MRFQYVICSILAVSFLFFVGCSKKKKEETQPSTAEPVVIVIPEKPTVVAPISLNALTNSDLTISGACESGATVTLEGDAAQTMICVASQYSFVVSKTLAGNYFLDISQANSAGSSGKVNLSWVLDNNVPADIIITSPLNNPFTSGNSSVSISGQCETGATVALSGSHTATTSCSGGAFSFNNLTQGADGSYNYSLVQTDLAGNSSVAVLFTWVRDTSIPPTPTITNFTDNTHHTNFSPLVISGSCVASNAVHVAQANVSLANTTCSASGTYTLNVAKGVDGLYSLSVYQIDATTAIESAAYDFQWVYDTQLPGAPVITSPTSSPATTSSMLVITGSCEEYATVNLTGDDNQSVVCVSQIFSFSVSQAVDGTYSYAIDQTDRAQNTSAVATQDWIRDSFALPMVTITTPSAQPFISNVAELTINGTCETGLTVMLEGVSASEVVSPGNSLSLSCVDSAFSYTISKIDGTHNLTLYQTNGVSNSAQTVKTWVKDTVAPDTTINTQPSSTNYSMVSSFAFTSNEASVTFQCSLDSAAYSTCVSPLNYSSLVNGVHTLNVRAVDPAGNIDSTPASYTWTQEAYKSIALYSFNATGPLADSGLYSGGVKNDLSDNSSGSVAGKFSEGRSMATTANYVSVADTPSQAAVSGYLTLESFVRLTSLPGSYAPVISKINSGASLASFEYGFRKQGSKYFIYFRGSLNGTSYTEVKSTNLTAAEETALTSGFAHVAVTWNLGSVKYYFNGVSKGTSSIGTVGSARLATSTAPLRIGYNGTNTLNGAVDEARISQIVRWSANFSVPTAAYTAD